MRSKQVIEYLRREYALDLRALALMRIGLALVILVDLIIRASDLKAFYTDNGIWPSNLSYLYGWKEGYWGFHGLSGSGFIQSVLFGLHGILACLLVLGLRTRWISLLLFIFTISLHNRNVFILQGGDDLLRLTLLWGIFLPWGARYSIDARRQKTPAIQSSFAFIGYLVFISSVYFFSALLKTGKDWHEDANAAYFALSLEQLRLPIGTWIYYHPGLLKIGTKLIYFFELFVPLLILSPWKSSATRLIAFLLIVLFHLTIGLTLYVGLFFIIGMVTSIGLLPSAAMDRITIVFPGKRAAGSDPPAVENPFLNGLCALVIGLSVIINLSALPYFTYQLRNEFLVAAHALRLDQYWGMFSPSVLRNDGWLVYHGRDSIGRQWDLRLDQDYVDYRKPERVVSMYKNDRWRKLAENLQMDRLTFLRPLYCRFILKQWNESHRKKIHSLSLYFVEKENLVGYKTTTPTPKLLCFCNED